MVTPSAGLMNPNHLAVAIRYLLMHRPDWPAHAAVGKTLVSRSMIDELVEKLGRRLWLARIFPCYGSDFGEARIAVEEASTLGWERWVGISGRVIGMNTFGDSAPLKELQRHFGFAPALVVAAARELLGRKK
jgi:hypothetical protein